MEIATDSLNFLDVKIKMKDTDYDTCMWRKLTNTRLLLKFHFIRPTILNSDLMMYFLQRAIMYVPSTLCTNKKLKTYKCYFKKMLISIVLSTK